MVRSQDIARIVGVSRQAVSAVLNGHGSSSVSAEKRAQIKKVARELDYQPNSQARALARGGTRVIGFAFSTVLGLMHSPIYPKFIASLIARLAERDYELSLLPIPDGEESRLPEIINSGRVEAVICHTGRLGRAVSPGSAARSRLVTFAETSSHPETEADFRIAGETGVAELADHLLKAGHTRIAYVGKEGSRLEQHRKVFAEQGFPLAEELICTGRNYRNDPGDSLVCFEETLRNWEKLRRCTAIIFNNDFFALGGCAALRLKGVEPGRDIAVTGQDDLENSSSPFLTTTTAPYDRLAERCAGRVCGLLAGDAADSSVCEVIPSQLIIRESTAAFRRKGRK